MISKYATLSTAIFETARITLQGWRGYKPHLFVFQEHSGCFVLKAFYYPVKSAQRRHCFVIVTTMMAPTCLSLCFVLFIEKGRSHILYSPDTEWGAALPNGNDNCSKGIKCSQKTLQKYSTDQAGLYPAPNSLSSLVPCFESCKGRLLKHPWMKILDTCRRSVQWSRPRTPLVVLLVFLNQSVLKRAADTEL